MSKQIENGVERVYPLDTGGREGELCLRLKIDGNVERETWLDIDATVSPVESEWLPRALSATLGARASQEEGPAAMFEKMVWQAAEWQRGIFKSDRVGGPKGFPARYEAIAKLMGISAETARDQYKALGKEEQAHIMERDDVKAAIKEIEALRESAGSLDALLS